MSSSSSASRSRIWSDVMAAGGQRADGVARRGLMFVLSSPSGAGKTTLSRMLMEKVRGLQMSVSVTTRPMRPGEVEGRDYFSTDKRLSEGRAAKGALLEGPPVLGKSSGPPRVRVKTAFP